MAEITAPRRAVAAALLFLAAAVLAGVMPQQHATVYRLFGLVEGLLAILLTFILLEQQVWERPPGPLGWIAVVYGTAANGQILALLLPGPGFLQWMSVLGFLFLAWPALAITSRRRLVGLLAGAAVLLALLSFSVIPFLWERSGSAFGGVLGLGSALDGIRRLVVDHEPLRPAGQLMGVVAVGLWALATRLLWKHGGEEEDWLASVPEGIRRQLDPSRPSAE